MKKVLITGNRNYGLCKSICDLFDTETNISYSCISRSNGFDLCSDQGKSDAVTEFINGEYDVFINNAALWKYHQTLLVQNVFDAAINNGKKSYLINIGSTADTGVRGRTWMYPSEKKALKAFNRDLSYMTSFTGASMRTTLVSPGSLNTPGIVKKHPDRVLIDTDYIAEIVLWLINQPEYVNIHEISLDAAQTGPFVREG